MINPLLCYVIFSIGITPQNAFLDHYTIIPPLGRVKSIATSPLNVFAISDDNLLIFDKHNLTLYTAIHFDQKIDLVGYDQWYNDLWIASGSNIIRFTITSYSVTEYSVYDRIDSFAISQDYLYLDGRNAHSLNKRTGELRSVNSFPGDLIWHKKTTDTDIGNYPFLTPYYYLDDPQESESPFSQFSITAIYDDGMDLYVGTDGYGLLKYNKVSWLKQRVIYGPLDSHIRKAKRFDDNIYFVSSLGVSFCHARTNNWKYQRFTHQAADFLFFDNRFVASFRNRISSVDGSMLLTISNMKTDVLCLGSDDTCMYIGTTSGLFKMYKGTSMPIPFGPDRFAVYSVYPMENEIFAGGETGFFKYNRKNSKWTRESGFGIKHIVEIQGTLYLLGTNNQIIKYKNVQNDSLDTDTDCVPLPYFNIYDIDTDDEVVYCASYAGIYYYEPETEFYKVVYNLPRIKYDYVFAVDKDIVAVSRNKIYSLPIRYRD